MSFLILSGKLNEWMNMFHIQYPVISSSRFLFRHPTDDLFSPQLICLLRQLKSLLLECLTDDDVLHKGNPKSCGKSYHQICEKNPYRLSGTTFLAILPLAFSSSQAFRVFFKMFFGIVVAGGPPKRSEKITCFEKEQKVKRSLASWAY